MNNEKNANGGEFRPELQVEDVADLLAVSDSVVHKLVKEKRIEHFRIRGSVRFTRDGVRRYLESVSVLPVPNEGEKSCLSLAGVLLNIQKGCEWGLSHSEMFVLSVVGGLTDRRCPFSGASERIIRSSCSVFMPDDVVDAALDSLKEKQLIFMRQNAWADMVFFTSVGVFWLPETGEAA